MGSELILDWYKIEEIAWTLQLTTTVDQSHEQDWESQQEIQDR